MQPRNDNLHGRTGRRILTDDQDVAGTPNATCTNLDLPNLKVTKTNNVSGATAVGSNFTWTTALTNKGTASASFPNGAAIFTDNLPNTGVTYGAASTSGASGITGTISCAVAASDLTCTANGVVVFAANATININVTGTPTAAGGYSNPHGGGICKVDPVGANGIVQESNEADNTCTDTVNVFAPPTVSKAFDTTTISPGGQTTLTLTITNPAGNPGNLTGVVVEDSFPSNLVIGTPAVPTSSGCGGANLTDNSGGALNAGDIGIRVNNATVAVGMPCIVTVNVTSSTPGTYNNTASASISTNGGTGVAPNTATLTVEAADLSLTKSDSPDPVLAGGDITYRINVTNNGPSTEQNATLSD